MTARQILFSGPMVRAILEGSKTMTRRVVKGAALECLAYDGFTPRFVADPENRFCPYGRPGDRLWVRETWRASSAHDSLAPADIPLDDGVEYAADGWRGYLLGKVRASVHMPRWASRITLEITAVRVERLQDITEADALAEGVKLDECGHAIREDDDIAWGGARSAFAELWASLHGADSWASNPWVWVVEFRRVEG